MTDHSKPPESARKAAERIIKYVNDSINTDPQIVINIMNYYADAQVADLMADLKAENERLKNTLKDQVSHAVDVGNVLYALMKTYEEELGIPGNDDHPFFRARQVLEHRNAH